MKISDIVTLKIEKAVSYTSNVSEMNNTGAILFLHTLESGETGTTDAEWLPSDGLEETYIGKTEIDRAINTYTLNGGISLVVKRLYLPSGTDDLETLDEINKAVYGGTGITSASHKALTNDIKNIQLVWIEAPSVGIASIASGLVKTSSPEETKLLFVTAKTNPTGLIFTPNVFYHYIGNSGEVTNYFESIAAMAYLSKINYKLDSIRGYEYTLWGDGDRNVNLLNSIDSSTVEVGGSVNYFSKTAGLNILIGGVMTNGDRLISYYFGLILTDRISQILARLTIEKLKFDQSTFTYLYNILTIELDKFADNGLLDRSFRSTDTKLIFRDGIRYMLCDKNQLLINGYIVKTLPPTQVDLSTRNYSGLYILYAIANQIRTLEIQGIVLGGMR